MNTFFKALLPGIVGSIAFWLLDKSLLRLGGSGQLWGMLAALIIFSGVSYFLLRRQQEGTRRLVASRRQIGGDATDRFDDVTIRRADDIELLSRNKIKGNSDVTVGRLDIE